MTWTRFMDMHSGGGLKLTWAYIYIEAPEKEARSVFYSRFGRTADNVTCDCCGSDYSVDESETVEQATAFERRCRYDDTTRRYVEETDPRYAMYHESKYVPLERYMHRPDVLFIRASEIAPEERNEDVPHGHYEWVED